MDAALTDPLIAAAQDREIASTVQRERGRLLAFIRRRIADAAEAEDVLQEALYELVLAYRMMQPVQQAGAWLTRVARHRIIDRFRKHKPQPLADRRAAQGEEPDEAFEDLLPAPDGEPESAVIRELLLGEIEAALGELPPEQREVFVAHELDGLSFRELSARSGVSVNTLLARKRYAVLHLQRRLRAAWDDWLLT
ncbi:MAG: RNA polymerase sigma factor [Gammaproteobacteria bacterium]|nr:MAG: RNA polymerase sigma factor [Gammaproteobacteria bacterium]TLZ05328.1 MAG: RNA polymerase sigma factor [Gammaproteobacteria bacterium]